MKLAFFGEDNRTRTYDPLHVKQMLYQLSYTFVSFAERI